MGKEKSVFGCWKSEKYSEKYVGNQNNICHYSGKKAEGTELWRCIPQYTPSSCKIHTLKRQTVKPCFSAPHLSEITDKYH